MSEHPSEFTPQMPWTIERQLRAYANAEGHTDRHEILYHTWRQNSRWFSRMLEYTVDSYPKYSQHNATHCQAVIHNIECLLGEDEIKRLSATDCYAILTAVYMHDVGMCITQKQKKDIVSSNAFIDWIDREMTASNPALTEHISNLRRLRYDCDENGKPIDSHSGFKKLYDQKLDTATSTDSLISDFQRKNHAIASSNWMTQALTNPGEMSYGLSLTGIPKRIHLSIADCAQLHGVAHIDELMPKLMSLRQEDNGFATDLFHPRFIAVLLLIGDALDIDNDRFHPYARTMAGGDLGEISETHYRKHQAIRSLQISPKKIFIRADCEKPVEMRMLRNDINWLQRFITECSYQWSSIAPVDYCGYLPRIDFEQISLGGKPIAEKLVKAQFHLSQQKAFKLLEGASLYDNRFVFLREMLQNAVDAIKLQYWNDLDATEFDTHAEVGLREANDELPLRKYPVKIDFAIRKRLKSHPDEFLPVTIEDIKNEDALNEYDFGVQVSIQDCGVGIGEDDVVAISKVGTSQDHRRNLIQNMPAWLHPTGKFGIGLQSLFQADRFFKCITRTHRDECYEMIFHSGTNNEGYINVVPKDWRTGENGSVPYGTKFILFVPHHLKESHSTNMSGWAGMDPYEDGYTDCRGLRRSFELMKQMESLLDSWVGESLFPVVIREEKLDITLRQENWDKKLAPHRDLQMRKTSFRKIDSGDYTGAESLLCWIFRKDEAPEKKILRGDLVDGSASYYMDVDNCTLYVWSQEAKCFFACSPKRIVQSITKDNTHSSSTPEERGSKIQVFLKGLLISELTYKEDELIEYIDIKNDQLQDHLYMSRSAFSPKGEQIIKENIIPLLQKTFRRVLEDINRNAIDQISKNRTKLSEWIIEHYQRINSEEIDGFDENDFFFIRKRELLQKRLNSCDLFDFTAVENDIKWALARPGRDRDLYAHNLDPTKSISGCHNLPACITQELFQDFPFYGNSKGYILRANTNIESKIEKIRKQNLDFFSLVLDAFSEKMSKLNQWFYADSFDKSHVEPLEDAKWVRDAMILYAMFYFYMNQTVDVNKTGCTESENKKCGWEYINRRIAYALSNLKEAKNNIPNSRAKLFRKSRNSFYSDVKSLLFVPTGAEGQLIDTQNPGYSIAELMLSENHFAVFSIRESKFDPWKHILVKLAPMQDRPDLHEWIASQKRTGIISSVAKNHPNPTILDVLEYRPLNKEECASRWAFMDFWCEQTIKTIRRDWCFTFSDNSGRDNRLGVSDEVWGSLVTRWIVRKFPTLALGSDLSGDNRINILSARAKPHIFYDARMIRLLVERINTKYSEYGAQRFMTPVWDGLDGLTCKEDVSTNILAVNRGTIPAESKKRQMLLAFKIDMPKVIDINLSPIIDQNNRSTTESPTDTRRINTFFQLLTEIGDTYSRLLDAFHELEQGAVCIPDFGLDYPRRLIKEYHNIQQMQPFHEKYSDSDLRIVRILQQYCGKHTERKPDRKLMARDAKSLEENISAAFNDSTLDTYKSFERMHISRYEGSTRVNYANITTPLDRQVFMCAFLFRLYNISLTNPPNEVADEVAKVLYGETTTRRLCLEPYSTDTSLNQAYVNIQEALEYCRNWAILDFRNAFLERICDWYWDAVWNKQNPEVFLTYSKKHLVKSQSDQELESLYRMQLRRIFCAAIIGAEEKYLKQ